MSHYESVFILNPALSEDQVKESVGKFTTLLKMSPININERQFYETK